MYHSAPQVLKLLWASGLSSCVGQYRQAPTVNSCRLDSAFEVGYPVVAYKSKTFKFESFIDSCTRETYWATRVTVSTQMYVYGQNKVSGASE
ncbi:uncharacterized protein F5891DRAFT_1005058 [Suillus fuscotomentosus]|uniref:Secreted protein n=1 Tax=Suillus fuscotomentosus TaxID=1912939 RepID=A0AAD4EHT2_9AGAM|nr:uncharacterized protein F5891DRAFT_1005058 [Suillus fuscotomentosus]KAG1906321.1 hypothetical protein F5891DRAFT_1005058 [Suillus fuscotomentosus]